MTVDTKLSQRPHTMIKKIRILTIIPAVLLFFMGLDSTRVPSIDHTVWIILYSFVSALLIAFAVTLRHQMLQLAIASLMAIGVVRGIAYFDYDQRIFPLLSNVLTSYLAMLVYLLIRRNRKHSDYPLI
jgi:hypothetical protein